MAETLSQRLNRAFQLIEAEQHAEARAELEVLLSNNRENPDVWWVYAHALDDPDRAEDALQQVLRLDPSYPGAQKLSASLAAAKSGRDLAPVDEDLGDLDIDAFVTDNEVSTFSKPDEGWDDLDDDGEESEPLGRPTIMLGALLVLVVVLGLILVFVVLDPFSEDTDDADPTAQLAGAGDETATAASGTPVPTIDIAVNETLEFPTPEEPGGTAQAASEPDYATFYAALDEFGVIEDSAEVVSTAFGRTLTLGVCSGVGAELRTTIETALPALARAAEADTPDVAAVGLSFIDCESDAILNVIAVDLNDAIDFASGDISEAAFRGTWRPVR